MLIQIKSSVSSTVTVYLRFDDMTDKTVDLNVEDIKTIIYTDNKGLMFTSTGKIVRFLIPTMPSKKEIVIVLDCSDEYSTNVIEIPISNIRDIYVPNTDQFGIVFKSNDRENEDNGFSKNIKYEDNNVATITLNNNITTKPDGGIDLCTLNDILRSQFIDDDKYRGKHFSSLYMDLSNSMDYSSANKYEILCPANIDIVDVTSMPLDIVDHKININPYAFRIQYRLTESDLWLDLTDVTMEDASNIGTIEDQLAFVLSIDKDLMLRKYGELYRFIPYKNGTEYTYIIKLYQDTKYLGTQYFTVKYNNKVIATDYRTYTNSAPTIVVGNTAQLITTTDPVYCTNDIIIYKSSNDNIATISSSGLVTAVAPGIVNISTNPEDNDSYINDTRFMVDVAPVEPSV